ncbi:NADH-quinone oxidoreductase subunit A, partial [candidate division KSB1 bacterium]
CKIHLLKFYKMAIFVILEIIINPNEVLLIEAIMLSEYIPVLILGLFGLAVGGAILIATHLFGPSKFDPVKNIKYESGIDPEGDARFRFNVKFYLVAMLFIIFDVEVVFLYPWAVVYKDLLSAGSFILIEMVTFIALLLLGYLYLLKKGAFEWD